MLDSVRKLEDKISTSVTDVAVIKSNYAPAADVTSEILIKFLHT